MPEDQSELWHLLSLLAEFQKSGLSRVAVHELRDPAQDTSVLLADAVLSRHRSLAHVVGVQITARDVCRDATVVLLLSRGGSGSGSGSLSLSLSMRGLMGVLLDLMGLLLVNPWLAMRILVLVREDVLCLQHDVHVWGFENQRYCDDGGDGVGSRKAWGAVG